MTTFVGSAKGTNTATAPAHAIGDLMLVVATRNASATAPTLPAGFTKIGTSTVNTNSIIAGFRICNSTSDATGTWTNATECVVHIYRPSAGGYPRIGSFAFAGGSSVTASYTGLTLQDTSGNSWVCVFGETKTAAVGINTAPTGFTLRQDETGTGELASFDSNAGVASFTTKTQTITSGVWKTFTVEIIDQAAITNVPLVQYASFQSNENFETGNAFVYNLPNATLSNNLLVLKLTYAFSAGRTIAISDGGFNTWSGTPAIKTDDSTNGITTALFFVAGATAGAKTLTVTFDAAIFAVQADFYEFYGIATSSPVDGTATGANLLIATNGSTALQSGSITTTADGDLILQVGSNTNFGTQLSGDAGDTFGYYAPGVNMLPIVLDQQIGNIAQAQIQTTHGAVNPAFYCFEGAGGSFNSLSIAFKTSAGAGTQRPAGIKIIGAYHSRVTTTGTADHVRQFPTMGNLLHFSTAYNAAECQINSIIDTTDGAWTAITNHAGFCQYARLENVTSTSGAGRQLVINATNGAANNLQFIAYDIIGAATSPFDLDATGSAGSGTGDITTATITPTTANGLVISIAEFNTGPPDSMSAPTGVAMDALFYTGYTDLAPGDSGDGYAHVYNSGTSAQSFIYHLAAATGGWFATAVAYKAAAVAGAVLVGTLLTPRSSKAHKVGPLAFKSHTPPASIAAVNIAALLATSFATAFGKLTFAGKSSLAAQSIAAAEGKAGIAGKTSLAARTLGKSQLTATIATAAKLSAATFSQCKSAATAAGNAALTGAGKLQSVARSAGTFTFALAARALAASSAKSSPLFSAKLSAAALSQAKASASLAGKAALNAATRAALQISAAITASSAGTVALLAISLIKSSAAALVAGRAPLSAKAQVNSSGKAGSIFTARLSAATTGMLKAGANVSGTIALAAKTALAGFGRLVPPGSIALIARAFGKMVAGATFSGKTPLIATAKVQSSAAATIAGRTALAALSRSAASARASFVSLIRLVASASISSTARATISARAALSGVAKATSSARLTLVGKLQLAAQANLQSSGTGNVVGIAPLVGIAGRTLIKFAARGLLLVFDPSPRLAQALFENRLVSALFENRSAMAPVAPANRTAIATTDGSNLGNSEVLSAPSPSWVPNQANPPDIAINWTLNQAWLRAGGITVTPDALGIATSRASVKQVVDVSGNWSQVASNTTAMSNLGRSTEEARTNSVRNNTMVGAVVGADSVELTTNGNFAAGSTGWTQNAGTGSISFTGGHLLMTGDGATDGTYIAQQISGLVVGRSYVLSIQGAAANGDVLVGSSAGDGSVKASTALSGNGVGGTNPDRTAFTATATSHWVTLARKGASQNIFTGFSVQDGERVENGGFTANPINASQSTLQNGWKWNNNVGTGTAVYNGAGSGVTITGDGTHNVITGSAVPTVAGFTYTLTVDITGSTCSVVVGTTFGGSTLLNVTSAIGTGQKFQFTATGSTTFVQFLKGTAVGVTINNVSVKSIGAIPTTWGTTGNTTGLGMTLGTPTVVNGVDCLPVTLSGTASATGTVSFIIENTAASLNAQTWTGSMFLQITSGAFPRLAQIEIDELDSGGALLVGTTTTVVPTSSLARYSTSRLNNNANTAKERIQFIVTATSGDVVNVSFLIGWPQLELGTSVTSPIKTTNAAATRAPDITTLTQAFGSAYSMLSRATPQAPTAFATAQTLLQLDNGASTQRTVMNRVASTGAVLVASVGGTGTSLTPAGTLTQNVQAKLASSWAAGAQAGCSNGGTVVTSAVAALPTTPTEISFGSNVGTEFLNGLTVIDAIWLSALSNAELIAITT